MHILDVVGHVSGANQPHLLVVQRMANVALQSILKRVLALVDQLGPPVVGWGP